MQINPTQYLYRESHTYIFLNYQTRTKQLSRLNLFLYLGNLRQLALECFFECLVVPKPLRESEVDGLRCMIILMILLIQHVIRMELRLTMIEIPYNIISILYFHC